MPKRLRWLKLFIAVLMMFIIFPCYATKKASHAFDSKPHHNPHVLIYSVAAVHPDTVSQSQCEQYLSSQFFDDFFRHAKEKHFVANGLKVSNKVFHLYKTGQAWIKQVSFDLDYTDVLERSQEPSSAAHHNNHEKHGKHDSSTESHHGAHHGGHHKGHLAAYMQAPVLKIDGKLTQKSLYFSSYYCDAVVKLKRDK